MTSEREAELQAVRLGKVEVLASRSSSWTTTRPGPRSIEGEAEKIRTALGERVLGLEHAGSTSVPDLAAKPIIDIVLTVADSADEDAYVPPLEAAGYALTIREPEWHEHRALKGTGPTVNLHVFSAGCPEIERMLAFRDRLRSNRGRPRVVREDEARARAAHVDVHAGLRGREDRSRGGNHRPSTGA